MRSCVFFRNAIIILERRFVAAAVNDKILKLISCFNSLRKQLLDVSSEVWFCFRGLYNNRYTDYWHINKMPIESPMSYHTRELSNVALIIIIISRENIKVIVTEIIVINLCLTCPIMAIKINHYLPWTRSHLNFCSLLLMIWCEWLRLQYP